MLTSYKAESCNKSCFDTLNIRHKKLLLNKHRSGILHRKMDMNESPGITY